MAESPACHLCQEQEETNLHLVRDCQESKKIWNFFVPPQLQPKFYSLPLRDWILWNITSIRSGVLSRKWKMKLPIVCWNIWKWRNALIFNNVQLQEQFKLESICCRVEEIVEAFEKLKCTRGSNWVPVDGMVAWTCPLEGRIKINVDRALPIGNKRAGIGCVARDCNGRWLLGEARQVNASTVLTAELTAILYGLQIGWKMNLSGIILESDSEEAIDLELGVRECKGDNFLIVKFCRELMLRNWRVEIVHVFREANRIADRLATRVAFQNAQEVAHTHPPEHLIDLLNKDAR